MIYLLFLLFGTVSCQTQTKCCKTFIQYFDTFSPECYVCNPYAETVDLIRANGYGVELINVTTTDGYILTMHHITNGTGRPVLIIPGFAASGISYVFAGNTSLAFVLAQNNYNVYLASLRPDRYASHVSLTKTDSAYWDFSIDQMASEDITAQVTNIYTTTNKKVALMGASMGTQIILMLATANREYAMNYVQGGVLFAPVAYLSHIRSIPLKALSYLLQPLILPLLRSATNGGIGVRDNTTVQTALETCLATPLQMFVCKTILNTIFGFDYPQWDVEHMPVYYPQNSDAFSINTLDQLSQIINSGKFRFYDYGKAGNLVEYNSTEPPFYDLTTNEIPMYVIHGENDYLADPKDVQRLCAELGNLKVCQFVNYPLYCHFDFLTAQDKLTLAYDVMLGYLADMG